MTNTFFVHRVTRVEVEEVVYSGFGGCWKRIKIKCGKDRCLELVLTGEDKEDLELHAYAKGTIRTNGKREEEG